jgi:hypothetical protein
MNRKLLRVLDEIDKTEAKIAEWQDRLASLHEQRMQLEEKEIVRAVRAMGMTSRELAAAVDGIYAGKLTLAEIPGTGGSGMPPGMETDGTAGTENCPDAENPALGSSTYEAG